MSYSQPLVKYAMLFVEVKTVNVSFIPSKVMSLPRGEGWIGLGPVLHGTYQLRLVIFFFIYLFFYFNYSYITYITVTENNLSTVTSIATLLTFFVLYKYVRYSAIQYLKQYWLKSD